MKYDTQGSNSGNTNSVAAKHEVVDPVNGDKAFRLCLYRLQVLLQSYSVAGLMISMLRSVNTAKTSYVDSNVAPAS